MLSVLTSRLLTTGQVARVLNVHVNTVRRWNGLGLLESCRIGARGDRRFSEDQVVQLMESLRRPVQKHRLTACRR